MATYETTNKTLCNKSRPRRAQTLTEYALILVVIVTVIIFGALQTIGEVTRESWEHVGNTMAEEIE